ncbi:hypothetical protein [Acinetobacter pittii]|uniref:hypothetical protein n=1 Tax=Acinetobacter pittii TaxID=48296 RepID=UPI00083F62F4|nr:hypothetical protein [Acinetobacter pittii]ODL95727.1 hypothetical protein AXH21_09630 [Acinetobacter pittii]
MPDFLLAIINFYNDLCTEEQDRDNFINFIERKFTEESFRELRSDHDFTIWLRMFVLAICRDKVESLYGKRDQNFIIYKEPNLKDSQRSRLCPIIDSKTEFFVCLGRYINNWEDFFYDICHESVHTLNPVFDIRNNPASALDEGVAVKFAENMYDKYIRPYSKCSPISSPLFTRKENNYKRAYIIAEKIPDKILCNIRKEFNSFGKINDIQRFSEITKDYLNIQEIEFICNNFEY